MEITGRLLQVLPVQSGQGKNGTWQKQEFVIETNEQYPKKICFTVWGEKINDLKNLTPGNIVKVQFGIESREYNGRWYTDAKAYRIESIMAQGNLPDDAPPLTEPVDLTPKEDDLPF